MDVRIEPAVSADLPAILSLLERSRLSREDVERHLGTAVVARDGVHIVGCAAVEVYGLAGLLRSVAVEEARRGEGLGGRLTEAALELARQRRVTTVYLLTETAAAFFPRFGFRTVARAEVAPAVRQSVEFTSACPESAQAMVKDL